MRWVLFFQNLPTQCDMPGLLDFLPVTGLACRLLKGLCLQASWLLCPSQRSRLRQWAFTLCLLLISLHPGSLTLVPMPRNTKRLQVKVVGYNSYLGAWAVDKGVRMQWTEGHDWVAEVDLSPDLNTFKV